MGMKKQMLTKLTGTDPQDLIGKSSDQIMFGAMYSATAYRLKKKGSNYTPPKKKRKK